MPAETTGSPDTVLVCIRGNSGSGKSSIARELRHRHGRGCALVEQDYLRRVVLRERDTPGGVAPALIEQTVRFALDHGYHVVLEGILYTGRYRDMLTSLRDGHRGRSESTGLEQAVETIAAAAGLPQH
ncbi:MULTISPECIES: AAA family ATPase [unclassified Micromonospora]|uniref:AAA family ATPase n=1 Tax=unclassified Micromonospora TaxID=2617518 RepID=UPI0003EEB6E2|nr:MULTISPECIES: AAA family ATPase [unclassified Micromonospora]EWM65627.1 hypothetical protein MCBG_02760 [Micromonospora sp. M42]MCK1808489.1 zeta toxin family protein [Micromonospora sp. R42106]MCK1833129.1 zeta toxin family protein [Micromonospora sp. R42003]MCK1844845.1 zeta toxin family protein [Micromonospora sp. R42004]MCM1018040.1 zeta toxin family protein [Micromonospora sp. XM-20-01]